MVDNRMPVRTLACSFRTLGLDKLSAPPRLCGKTNHERGGQVQFVSPIEPQNRTAESNRGSEPQITQIVGRPTLMGCNVQFETRVRW